MYPQVCPLASQTVPFAVLLVCVIAHDVTVVTVGDVAAYEQMFSVSTV